MNVVTRELTADNFDAEVIEAKLPVLVDFWAPWCTPCRAMSPVLDAITLAYEGKVIVGKLNVDDFTDLSSKYQVQSLPTVVVFKDGKPVETVVGRQSKGDLEALLGKVLAS